MYKLNNKGLSAVEVIVCFSIVSVMAISLLNIVMSYKDKQEEESYRSELITYKNTITEMIQKDVTEKKLVKVEHWTKASLVSVCDGGPEVPAKLPPVTLYFADGTYNQLGVFGDLGAIMYDGIKYQIPNFGTVSEKVQGFKCENIQALRISNVEVKEENNMFILNIDFYHHLLGNKYGIHIIAPLDYK